MGKFIDITGKRFGKLEVIKYCGGSKWVCNCDCGGTTIVAGPDLKNGHTASCGCNKKKFSVDDGFFESINTEEKAYVLGFISSDGYVNKKLNQVKVDLKSTDEDVLVKIKNAMNYTNSIKHYTYSLSVDGYKYVEEVSRLVISSPKLVSDLENLGVTQAKSNIIRFPFGCFDKSLYRHYFRGYFDGDGSISINHKRNNAMSINITSSDEMCCDMSEILKEIFDGITIYKYHRKKSNPNNSTIIVANREYVIRLMEWMYEDSAIYLDRKYHKYQEINHIKAQTTTSVSDG